MRVKNRSEILNDLGKFMAAFGWVTVGMSVLLGVVLMGAIAPIVSRSSGVVLGLLIIIAGSASGIIMSAIGQIMQYLVIADRRAQIAASTNAADSGNYDLTQSVAA